MATATKEKTEKGQVVFLITMAGLYFAKGQNGMEQKRYEVVFPMSKFALSQTTPQAFFKHHIAGIVMPRKYSDYEANSGLNLATFYVTNARATINGKEVPELLSDEISLLTREGLCQHIEDRGLPIETYLYDDDMSIRQAIIDCNKDRKGFEKNQKEFRKRKKNTLEMRKYAEDTFSVQDLFDLNNIKDADMPAIPTWSPKKNKGKKSAPVEVEDELDGI